MLCLNMFFHAKAEVETSRPPRPTKVQSKTTLGMGGDPEKSRVK